jgi:2-keto-4-pentenoate hydratase/2-oxohepta-3-ene-1,7-dioic acid hydratase in catechol pathway
MRLARIAHQGVIEFAVSPDARSWLPMSTLGGRAETLPEALVALSEIPPPHCWESGGTQLTEPDLLAPVHGTGKVVAIGLNYPDHAGEVGMAQDDALVVFAKLPNTINGPYGEIDIDETITREVDYEAELAVVIGARCRAVPLEEAIKHVFGYTVANDVSARDLQRTLGRLTFPKSLDTFLPIGPWICTADEVGDPAKLTVTSSVNGEPRQRASVSSMTRSVAQLISEVSAGITLDPGDVLLTGSPTGSGTGFQPPRYLREGDIVECSISGLGAIRNRVRVASTGAHVH